MSRKLNKKKMKLCLAFRLFEFETKRNELTPLFFGMKIFLDFWPLSRIWIPIKLTYCAIFDYFHNSRPGRSELLKGPMAIFTSVRPERSELMS